MENVNELHKEGLKCLKRNMMKLHLNVGLAFNREGTEKEVELPIIVDLLLYIVNKPVIKKIRDIYIPFSTPPH